MKQVFRNSVVVAAILALLAACTTAKPMTAPSGKKGIKIWCENTSACYKRAAEECPSGYVVEVDQKDNTFGDIDGNLIIVCRSPAK